MMKKTTIWAITLSTLILAPIFFGIFSQGTSLVSSNSDERAIVSDKLFINEFMADNDGAVISPQGTFSDWIELYNAADETIDLSGMYLTNDLAHPKDWEFPDGTLIEPGAYLIIWVGNFAGQEGLNANFPLNANSGEIGLFDQDGKILIDSITYGKQIRDVSYGRAPDGSSTWHHMTTPTPNAANILDDPPEKTSIWTVALIISLILLVSGLVIIAGKIMERRRQL
jgi:hypothetical protein